MNTVQRICPFCEATCGLDVVVDGRRVVQARGAEADRFSRGYVCPKGTAFGEFIHDPDRLRTPLAKRGGKHVPISWEEAFALVSDRLAAVRAAHGPNAVAAYLGNPTVHNTTLSLYGPALLKALGTANLYSASSVDQLPKQLVSALLFGTGLSVPIPDLDRCQYLMIFGANPLASNGSLMTAPDVKNRLKAIQARGGRIVVFDPRRTHTADLADRHYPIRPGTDAYLMAALVNVLVEEQRVAPGALADHLTGLEEALQVLKPFTAEAVAHRCGIDAPAIRGLALELADAPTAAVYGRIGTCTQEFGTLASWLPEVLHVLTGNLDRPGGALFTRPAHGPGNTKGTPGLGRGLRMGRRKSRVSGRAELFGEFPVSVLSEEIETPGEGQIRALLTVCGNPVLSTPNSARLSRALASLDFMVSIDVYLNETTRHADLILPDVSPMERCHYDMAFSQLAIRDMARYSPAHWPVVDRPDDREMMLRLIAIAGGLGLDADLDGVDDLIFDQLMQRELVLETSPVFGREPEFILRAMGGIRGPERMLDFMLRTGPYGDGFGANPGGLNLAAVAAAPEGIDLGPLKPRIPEVLRTPDGKINLAPSAIVADVARLEAALKAAPGLVLVGRRHLRSNNSWMHNLPGLVKGKARCTLQMHPDDAARAGLADGERAQVSNATGSVCVVVEVTDRILEGVVSLPHGWGHDGEGLGLSVAGAHAGVNSNLLTDEHQVDVPSGNAVLNGIPVAVKRAAAVADPALSGGA